MDPLAKKQFMAFGAKNQNNMMIVVSDFMALLLNLDTESYPSFKFKIPLIDWIWFANQYSKNKIDQSLNR